MHTTFFRSPQPPTLKSQHQPHKVESIHITICVHYAPLRSRVCSRVRARSFFLGFFCTKCSIFPRGRHNHSTPPPWKREANEKQEQSSRLSESLVRCLWSWLTCEECGGPSRELLISLFLASVQFPPQDWRAVPLREKKWRASRPSFGSVAYSRVDNLLWLCKTMSEKSTWNASVMEGGGGTVRIVWDFSWQFLTFVFLIFYFSFNDFSEQAS